MEEHGVSAGWRRFWNRGRWWKAFLVAAVYSGAYLLIGLGVSTVFGAEIDVADIFGDGKSLFLAVVLPILLGGVLALLFVFSLRWVREIFARQPIRGPRWMWIAVPLTLIPIALHAAATDWGNYSFDVLLAAVALGVAVGFVEELLTRGIAVNILRRAGLGERWVAVLSSLVFALLHLGNLVSGQPLVQVLLIVVFAFGFGMMMYLVMRATGSIIWPMIIHGFTDPTTMLATGGIDAHGANAGADGLNAIAGLFNGFYPLLAVVLVFFIKGRVDAARARSFAGK